MIPNKPLGLNEATRLAKELFAAGYFVIKQHFRKRMAERDVNLADVENVIRCGVIKFSPELKPEGWTYQMETPDMVVVVAFEDKTELKLVSTWKKD